MYRNQGQNGRNRNRCNSPVYYIDDDGFMVECVNYSDYDSDGQSSQVHRYTGNKGRKNQNSRNNTTSIEKYFSGLVIAEPQPAFSKVTSISTIEIQLLQSNIIKIKLGMAQDTYSTFKVSTGTYVSVFKKVKVCPNHPIQGGHGETTIDYTQRAVQTFGSATSELHLGNVVMTHKFMLVPNFKHMDTDGILGNDFLSRNNGVIEMGKKTLKLKV